MGKISNILFLMAGIIIMASCASMKKNKEETDSRDLSYLYNPLRNPIHPRYQVYNVSEDLSELTIKFFTNDLFFTEANPEGVPRAELIIIYRLYNMSQGRVAVDTGFYNVKIRKGQGNRQYTYTIPMRADMGSKYEAELAYETEDMFIVLPRLAEPNQLKSIPIRRYTSRDGALLTREEIRALLAELLQAHRS